MLPKVAESTLGVAWGQVSGGAAQSRLNVEDWRTAGAACVAGSLADREWKHLLHWDLFTLVGREPDA